MGIFDDVVGAVKGAVLEGAEGSAQGVLHNVLGNSSLGGLDGLVGQLQTSGLGDLVSSWTGGGQGRLRGEGRRPARLRPRFEKGEGHGGSDLGSGLFNLTIWSDLD